MKTKNALQQIACCIVLAILAIPAVQAQAPTHTGKFSPVIDQNINGFYEYLPRNYSTDLSTNYPLIIFFHAGGESGTGMDMATLDKVTTWGTPKLIKDGVFPDSFNVGGQWHKFIVISPQIKTGLGWTVVSDPGIPPAVDAVVEYAKTAYRVDPARIYLCGMSMGGSITWGYAGSNASAANKLAAIVVACGAGDLNSAGANTIAAANLPVLATHNKGDVVVDYERTDANIALINAYAPAITPSPKVVKWEGGTHNVWSRAFEDINPGITSQGLSGNLRDTLGVNIYEWMLQYTRSGAALPLQWQSFSVKEMDGAALLRWTITAAVNTFSYTIEKSFDGRSWSVIGSLPAQSASGNIQSYQYTDPAQDPCFYRIRQTDLDGKFTYSPVQKFAPSQRQISVKLYPNPLIDKLIIRVTGISQERINIKLVNAAGRVVLQQQRNTGNSQSITIDNLQLLNSGVYYAIVEDSEGVVINLTRLVK